MSKTLAPTTVGRLLRTVLIATTLWARAASFACSCSAQPLDASEVNFTARFLDYWRFGDALYYLASVRGVSKGSAPSILIVASGSGTCGSFRLDTEYLVAGDYENLFTVGTSICHGTRLAQPSDNPGHRPAASWWLIAPGLAPLVLLIGLVVLRLLKVRRRSGGGANSDDGLAGRGGTRL